jgi:hypothetical protein
LINKKDNKPKEDTEQIIRSTQKNNEEEEEGEREEEEERREQEADVVKQNEKERNDRLFDIENIFDDENELNVKQHKQSLDKLAQSNTNFTPYPNNRVSLFSLHSTFILIEVYNLKQSLY